MTGTEFSSSERSERSEGLAAHEIRAEVERILASSEFVQSERLKQFLRHIVEEHLADRSDRLSEYSIGLDVFDRDESFDPQTSSIVRVEASRLRSKLEKYNASDGTLDPVRIALPRGRYAPSIERAELGDAAAAEDSGSGSSQRSQPTNRAVIASLAVAMTVATIAAVLVSEWSPFGSAVEWPDAASGSPGTYSVAVLPLRNLSQESDNDYFSDGITDALTTSLAREGGFRVTSMTSAMAYRNVDRPLADIAQELNVSHVVAGSVLRVGDRIRISAQLIDAGSDQHIWAESYERDASDVLALQDEVVSSIVSSLTGRVGGARQRTSREIPGIDPSAYESYLRGIYFRSQMTEEGLRKGLAYFEEAIERAPDYAPARSGLAACYCLLGGHGFEIINPHEAMPSAKAAVLEALRLDDTLAEAHAFLGIIRLKYEWDWPGAEEEFKRSIELNPNYAQVRIFFSYFLEAMGRQEAAVREAEHARLLDPLSLAANVNLGWQLLQADRPEDARQIFEKTLELDPNFWGAHWGIGQYHRRKAEFADAIAAFQRAIDAGGGHAMPLTAIGYTYAIAGQPDRAYEIIIELNSLSEKSYVSPFNMAIIHASLGDADAAFASLETAFSDRSRSMAWLNVTRDLDALRQDPRFEGFLDRVGLAHR